MAYDGTIPSLSNQIGNDIPQMQENFALLEDSQVVDEGSTDDGDYIRYENGWQACFKLNFTLEYNTSNFLQSRWNFPVVFASKPFVIPVAFDQGINENAPDETTLSNLYTRISENDEAFLRLVNRIDSPFSEGDTVNIAVFAIGRWK